MMLVSLFAALLAAASGQAPVGGEILTKEQADARLANCGARRFESVAEFEIDGKMKRSRLELCAKDGDTQAEWIATLEKNEAAIKAQTRLPESARFKLLSDLRAEIDRLKGSAQSLPIAGASIAAVPGLAVPKAPVVAPSSDFEVAALPPLPPPKPAGSVPAAASAITRTASAAPAAPPGLRPKLAVKCAVPGGNPINCDHLAIDDLLIIEAEENLASPLTLTFRRTKSGDVADVTIRRLRQGDVSRIRVPAAMCKGVVRTTFDVQVSGPGTGKLPYADLLGPFRKDC